MLSAKDVPIELYREAASKNDDSDRRAFATFAIRSESERSLRASIALAQSEPGIPAHPDNFDADPWLLNTQTGLVDLRTCEIAAHAREAMCSQICGTGYEPGIRSELWERCLETWLPDRDVRSFVKRSVGYTLIGATLEQVIFILWGDGANGKSVFVEVIRKVLGSYALHTPADTLISNRGSGIPNDIARLKGARFVSASESGENRLLAEAKVKALTGGDTITARFMRGEFFEFEATFAIWISTNHKPVIRGQDDGIWRRIRLIPFNSTIPKGQRDSKLQLRLESELPAILTWAVEGCLEYQRRGLDAPAAVTAATDDYRRESDLFGDFLDDRCVIGTGRFATSRQLHDDYRNWAKTVGVHADSKTAFGKRLSERGFTQRKHGGERGWAGLSLDPLDT